MREVKVSKKFLMEGLIDDTTSGDGMEDWKYDVNTLFIAGQTVARFLDRNGVNFQAMFVSGNDNLKIVIMFDESIDSDLSFMEDLEKKLEIVHRLGQPWTSVHYDETEPEIILSLNLKAIG